MHSLMKRKGGAGGEGRMEEGRRGGERRKGGGREGERGERGGKGGEGYGGRGRECVWERERENVCFDT